MLFILAVCLFQIISAGPPLGAFPYRIEKEYQDFMCKGSTPAWLKGTFVRQCCGAFGVQGKPQTNPPTKIEHLFDCLGMVATYKFEDGRARFSNKLYDTHNYKVWEHNGFNFQNSKIGWYTTFSHFDPQQAQLWSQNWTEADGFYSGNPNVNFWPIGPNVEAVDESTLGLKFDINNLEMEGPYPFQDNFNQEVGIAINNPAHGTVDVEGTRWATVGSFQFLSQTTGKADLLLYKITNDARVIQGSYPIGTFDLSLCSRGFETPYPQPDQTLGYMHSFAMTPNYVILPVSSLSWDYCGLFVPKPPANAGDPIFFSSTRYREDKKGKYVIYDRNSMKFIKAIEVPHFFATHQANWWEENGKIVCDMVYYDYDIYSSLFTDDVLNGFANKRYDNKFVRVTISTSNWSITTTDFKMPNMVEFPHMNNAYKFKDYNYVYMVENLFMEKSAIIKFNVKTKEIKRWMGGKDVYPAEPVFVARPGATSEDDGAVVFGIVNGTHPGAVIILDAKSFTEIGRVDAPEKTPFGLHNYFAQN